MAMPNEGGFTFANFLADVFAVFVFVVLIWLLYIVFSDLFRRRDISGWGKALWVIGVVLFPYIGVLAYMIVESKGMAERADQQAQQTQDEVRRVVGFSVADEIKKLDELKKSGSITDQEYARLRGRLVQ
jgi:Phospholipase_D-nuclease N-terminal